MERQGDGLQQRHRWFVDYLDGDPDGWKLISPTWTPSRNQIENWVTSYFGRLQRLAVVNTLPSSRGSLSVARLGFLDGRQLSAGLYTRIPIFVRLWRRLIWTINEVNKSPQAPHGSPEISSDPKVYHVMRPIPPAVLDDLASLLKLVEITGLGVLKFFPLWSPIRTRGDSSHYHQLFLTHNLSNRNISEADDGENYLTRPASISDNKAVVLATLNLILDDLNRFINRRIISDNFHLRMRASYTAIPQWPDS